MIDLLRPMAIYVELVKCGSFRGAAKALGLSPSVLSHHINQLESRLDTTLVYRSTRRLALTAAGEKLYLQANKMLEAAELGLSAVGTKQAVTQGRLKIAFPALLTRAPILQCLAKYASIHPGINFDIHFHDERQNIIANGFDLALRMGKLENSNLKMRKITEYSRRLVCSPQYMTGKAPVKTPSDLSNWDWIQLQMLPDYRTLINRQKQKTKVKIKSNLMVNSVEAMSLLCVEHLGLATPPSFLVDDLILQGDLVEVLPDWKVETIPLYAVWPKTVQKNSLAQQLVKFLLQH